MFHAVRSSKIQRLIRLASNCVVYLLCYNCIATILYLGDSMLSEAEFRVILEQGETETVEFKSDRVRLNDRDLVEAIVCLANSRGGKVFLGVEDNGVVTGIHPSRNDERLGRYISLISSRTVPSLYVEIYPLILEDNTIIVFDVQPSPVIIATSDGRTIRRTANAQGQPECIPLYPTDVQSWYADRGMHDATARIMEACDWDDLDPLEFVRLRRLLAENRGDSALAELSDEDLAKALGLVRGGNIKPTLAGLLLVGKEAALLEQVPAHEVAFQVLRGQDVAVNTFMRWPLLRVFEYTVEAFNIRNEEHELTIDLARIGVPAYDQRAFREALNNALTHRDYARMGAVHVQLHDDAIVIINPGGFVEGLQANQLLISGPRPRNPLLADIFKRVGLVERTGRGVRLIYSGMLRTGRIPPDYSQSNTTRVQVRLPGGAADLDFVRIIVGEEKRLRRGLSLDELLLLSHIRQEREVTVLTASDVIQKSESETRRILEGLVEAGIVARRGGAMRREYFFSAMVFRKMGRTADYVRRVGYEDIQQEHMIMQFVQAHETITRSDVINLCNVTPHRARYILSRLKQRGWLQQVGHAGMNVYYTSGPNAGNFSFEQQSISDKEDTRGKDRFDLIQTQFDI